MATSLVLDLQRKAMDPNAQVSDVVRTSLAVATKLAVEDLRQWCEKELRGYSVEQAVPTYRQIEGQIKAFNPYQGWIPVGFYDAKLAKTLASRHVRQSIGELEDLYGRGDEKQGGLQMPFSQDTLNKVFGDTEAYRLGVVPTVLVSRAQVYAILDAVRNAVLEWSLRLEKDAILGEGLTFSPEERQKAEAVTYNIQQFTGVLGNVQGTNVQVGNYNSIHGELKKLGVPQDERNELEEILDELPKATPKKRTALVKRGMEWLARNGPGLGALSETIRSWFQQ